MMADRKMDSTKRLRVLMSTVIDVANGRGGLFIALNRLMQDRRGVGAVEFALLAPILLMVYICAFELTLGLSVAKRTTRSAGAIADLVTQQTTVSKTYLQTMRDVAEAIFVPYDTMQSDDSKRLKLKITGIKIDSTGTAKVAWSWNQDNGRPYAVGDAVDVPADLKKADTFLVHTELSKPHKLLMFLSNTTSLTPTSITITRDYFFRQRTGDDVKCGDC